MKEFRMRIGFYYPHIFDKGGYPRDIHRLMEEANLQGCNVIPILSLRELIFKRKDIDLLHIFGAFRLGAIASVFISKTIRIATVWSPLGQLLPFALYKKSWKKKLFLTTMGTPAMRHVDAMHAFTKNEAESIRKLGFNENIFKSPLGLYPEDQRVAVSNDSERYIECYGPYVLFLGRLDIYQKGIDILLDGFLNYIESGGKMNLVICGQDWRGGHDYINYRLLDKTFDQRVFYLGFVELDKKWNLMREAKAFIYSSRFDGPPRPIRDALVMQKKIIISREANIYDDIESLGWGCEFDVSPLNLSTSITRFEDGYMNEYIDPMSCLSWPAVAKRYVSMYRVILKKETR